MHAGLRTTARFTSNGFTTAGFTTAGFTTPRRAAAGFTVLELVVVLAIIALLAGGATVGLMATLSRAKVSSTKTDIQTVASAIQQFQVNQGTLPTTLQNLVDGEYVSKPSDIEDAWGNDFFFQAPAQFAGQPVDWMLISLGKNGTFEGEAPGSDDIILAEGHDVFAP